MKTKVEAEEQARLAWISLMRYPPSLFVLLYISLGKGKGAAGEGADG